MIVLWYQIWGSLMTSIHVRKIDENLLKKLKQEAGKQRISVNSLVLSLLRYGLGISYQRKLPLYQDLDKFIGTWSAKDVEEFKKSTSDFEKIDEDMWR